MELRDEIIRFHSIGIKRRQGCLLHRENALGRSRIDSNRVPQLGRLNLDVHRRADTIAENDHVWRRAKLCDEWRAHEAVPVVFASIGSPEKNRAIC